MGYFFASLKTSLTMRKTVKLSLKWISKIGFTFKFFKIFLNLHFENSLKNFVTQVLRYGGN